MRCPDCNKFASMDLGDVEITEENLENQTVTISARIVRNCADCGTELKEASFDLEQDVEDQMLKHEEKEAGDDLTHDYSYEINSSEATESSDCGVNKKTGKPNKYNARYATNYFGVSVSVAVKCDTCSAQVCEVTLEDKVAASGMDEMV